MCVDKAGVAEHMRGVERFLRLLREILADGTDHAVLGIEINVFIDRIMIVAGDETENIAQHESFHRHVLTFRDAFIIPRFREDASL